MATQGASQGPGPRWGRVDMRLITPSAPFGAQGTPTSKETRCPGRDSARADARATRSRAVACTGASGGDTTRGAVATFPAATTGFASISTRTPTAYSTASGPRVARPSRATRRGAFIPSRGLHSSCITSSWRPILRPPGSPVGSTATARYGPGAAALSRPLRPSRLDFILDTEVVRPSPQRARPPQRPTPSSGLGVARSAERGQPTPSRSSSTLEAGVRPAIGPSGVFIAPSRSNKGLAR